MKNIFKGKNYRITVLTKQLIRLEYSENGYFEDGKTKIVQNRQFEFPEFDVIEDEERLEIITDSVHVYYKKGEFSPANLFIDARNNLSPYGNRWYYGENYETLKGTTQTLDMINGETELEEGIISKNGFAILDDSESFLLKDENPVLRPDKEIDLYFFGYGRDYFGALKDFYFLTGHPPLLPRYALGNWWSRFWKYSEDSYLELMERFESEEVPLSVSVIDMDWHLTDIPERFGSSWTGYSWNKELFPQPERFIRKLHDRGLKVTLNVHPADGIRAFEDSYSKVAERMGLNQELEQPALFDISNPVFREAYFEDVHHEIEKQGVDFWWIDWQQGIKGKMNDIDPLWLLNYYHYQDISHKGENDIILSRYSGPGSHRYPVGFSGDTIITWESLAFQPYFTITASNIGYTWWSHDIGGHMDGYHDEELALRWVQFGAFSPINRLHSSNSLFSGKEPWSYSKEICENMKRFLYLRHEFLPYLYTMNVKTHEDGLPLITPMYYYYPMEEDSYQVPNQYFYGTELMVAPITEKINLKYKTAKVDTWLPEGVWYDFFTDVKYKGGVKLSVYRELDLMPIFVKEGGIIPLDSTPKITGTDLPEIVDWHIFPGKNNYFELVEDLFGKRVITRMDVDHEKGILQIKITGDLDILPTNRKHQLVFHHMKAKKTLLENKAQKISFKKGENVSTIHKEWLFRILNRAEIEYDIKSKLWERLSEETELSKKITIINKVEPELRGRLFELIYTQED